MSLTTRFLFLFFTVFAFISLLGCGSILRDIAGMEPSLECSHMEKVCKEASEYREKYYEANIEERATMEAKLKGLEEACSDAMKRCNESQHKDKVFN